VILTYGLGHGHDRGGYHINEKPWPMMALAHWGWHDDERDVPVGDGLFRKEPCRVLEFWRTQFGYKPTHWMPLPTPPVGED